MSRAEMQMLARVRSSVYGQGRPRCKVERSSQTSTSPARAACMLDSAGRNSPWYRDHFRHNFTRVLYKF